MVMRCLPHVLSGTRIGGRIPVFADYEGELSDYWFRVGWVGKIEDEETGLECSER